MRAALALPGWALAIALAWPTPAWAAAPPTPWPQQWASFKALALQAAPEALALRAAAVAKAEAARSAGVAPRPMVELGWMDLPSAQGPQLSLAQGLPLGPQWAAQRALADQEASEAQAAWRLNRRQLVWRLGQGYWAWLGAHAQLGVAHEAKAWADLAARLNTAALSAAQGQASEALAAQLGAAEASLKLTQAQNDVAVESTRLAELMGQGSWPASLHPSALPPTPTRFPATPPQAQDWAAWWAAHPEAQLAQASIARAEAALRLAQSASAPEWQAKLSLGQWPMGSGWQTMWGGMLGASFPGPWEQAALAAQVAQAQAGVRQTQSEAHARHLRWRGEAERTWLAWRLAHAQSTSLQGPQSALAQSDWRLQLGRLAQLRGASSEAVAAQARLVALKRQGLQAQVAYHQAASAWAEWVRPAQEEESP